jgi:hypothetical protein
MEKSITNSTKPKKGKGKRNEEKRTTIKEIENGFIITRSISWDDDKGYHHDEKQFYSETNPLESVDKSLADKF